MIYFPYNWGPSNVLAYIGGKCLNFCLCLGRPNIQMLGANIPPKHVWTQPHREFYRNADSSLNLVELILKARTCVF